MHTNWSAADLLKAEHIPKRGLSGLARRAVRGWRVALAIFVCVAVGLAAAVPFTPPVYWSGAGLMLTSGEGDINLASPAEAAARAALVDEEVATFNSAAVIDRIAAELNQRAPGQAAAIAKWSGGGGLSDVVKARRRGESYLVDVEAKAPTPQGAKLVVEAAIEIFQARQLDRRFASAAAEQRPLLATAPVSAPRVELARLEAEKATILGARPAQTAVASGVTNKALAEARRDAAALKALLRSEVTADDLAEFRASGAVDRLGDAAGSFAGDLLTYGTTLATAKDDPAKADDVKFRKYRILTLASQLQSTLDERVLRAGAAAPSPAASTAGEPEAVARQIAHLDLQIEAQRKFVDAIAANQPAPAPATALNAADIDVRVVSRPGLGRTSVWRQPAALYSAAVSVALLLALAYLVFATLASNTVIDSRDAAALAGAPLVGSVPRITASQLRGLPPDSRHPANFPLENPASAFAGAMREALTALSVSTGLPEGVCVAVAGAQAGDGATTISLALARSAAASGIRVLLIDTDFDAASLTRSMNIEPAAGIEAILDGQRQLAELVVEDDLTSVHLLPSAPSKISRGALSLAQLMALKAALANAKTSYELIIIDCQPPSARSRSRSMARMADVALVVASHDLTKREMLSVVAKRTRQNGTALRGVVVNRAPEPRLRERSNFPSDTRPAKASPRFTDVETKLFAEIRSIH